jgi:hypothetical protein
MVALGSLVVSSGHAAPNQSVLEVSNSCAAVGSTSQLVIWGSNLAGGTLMDTGLAGIHLFQPMPEPAGNFTVTVTIAPTIVGTDVIELFTAAGTVPASRDLLIELPPREPACPATTPGPSPCLPPGQPIPATLTGILPTFTDPPTVFADTAWFVDYRGTNAGQTAATTSPDVNGATSTTLPGSVATPGPHMITALSQPAPIVAGPPPRPPFLIGPNDVYTTFPIVVCQPPPPTTTTTVKGTVPTTTGTSGPTTTAAPGAPTTLPPLTLPPTTAPPVTSPPSSPTLTVNPGVGYGGEVTEVHGSGFPPGVTVTLEWLPGIGTVAAPVAPDGTFTVGFLVFPHDRIGARLVHAQGFPATVAAVFLDELGPEEPPAAANGEWIFRQA